MSNGERERERGVDLSPELFRDIWAMRAQMGVRAFGEAMGVELSAIRNWKKRRSVEGKARRCVDARTSPLPREVANLFFVILRCLNSCSEFSRSSAGTFLHACGLIRH